MGVGGRRGTRTRCSPDTFRVEAAGTLSEALAAVGRQLPDVVLLDLNLPDSSGYSTFLNLRRHASEACLIVLTSVDDDEVALRAVDDGADDYLVKQLTHPGVIARRIRMARKRQDVAGAPAGGYLKGRALGFLGVKGGVGTSTIAVNVAAALAGGGVTTTFIDLEPGPGIWSQYISARPARDLSFVLEKPARVMTPSDIEECVAEPIRGLRLLGIPESRGVWRPLRREYVDAIVALSRQTGSCPVLDLGSRVDDGVAAALGACECLILVIDADPGSIACGAAMCSQLESVMRASPCDLQMVAVERVPGRDFPLEEVARTMKMAPIGTIRSAADALGASYSADLPLAALHPEDGFSRDIQTLVDSLCIRLRATAATPAQLPSPGARRMCRQQTNQRNRFLGIETRAGQRSWPTSAREASLSLAIETMRSRSNRMLFRRVAGHAADHPAAETRTSTGWPVACTPSPSENQLHVQLKAADPEPPFGP
ncbi:MAG TPA: response regulator [Bryobacteraceae bacterium]|nr:response regulator [Bryobacteraceae bacterium]